MWTLIVCGLRLPELSNSLWLDELHTGWVVAADSWDELSRRARLGNQAPLWFYLPWIAVRLCGTTEFALRLPSLLAGGLLIPALYWATYRATRCHPAALVAAVLAGCDSHFLFYAREARGYATVQLVGVLHLALLLARIDGDRRAAVRAGWWLSGAAMFYLHYTTALVFPCEWLALVFAPALKRDAPPGFDSAMFESSVGATSSRDELRSRIVAVALDVVVLTAACAAALFHVREIAARRGDWAEFLSAESVWRVLPWAGYLGAAAAGLAVVVFARRSSRDQPLYWLPRIEPLAALAAVSVGPWLVASLATHGGVAHLLLYRYLIVPACALPILAAAAVAVSPGRAARGFVAFAVVGATLAGNSYFTHAVAERRWPAERNERWRELIADLNREHAEQPADRRLILLCGAMVEDRRLAPSASRASDAEAPDATLVDFCRFPLRSLYRLHIDDTRVIPLATMSTRRFTEARRRQLVAAGGARLIVRGDEHLTAEIVAELKAELASSRDSPSSSDRHRVRAISPPKSYGDVQLVEIHVASD